MAVLAGPQANRPPGRIPRVCVVNKGRELAELAVGDRDLDQRTSPEVARGRSRDADDVEHAFGRPQPGLQSRAETHLFGLIEVPVAPAHFHVLRVGEVLMLRPGRLGDVRPANHEARVPPVAHDVHRPGSRLSVDGAEAPAGPGAA